MASRPVSLVVAAGPVIVGAACSLDGSPQLSWPFLLQILLASLLMQVICNLQNDVGFNVRGGEVGGTRIGLPRASTSGLLTRRQLKTGIWTLSLLALALGLHLYTAKGWPVLVVGCASLIVALSYMGGPKPLAYTPFGESTVFTFFGLVAVPGCTWMLAGTVTPLSALCGAAVGSFAAAALAVNNYRDAPHDASLARKTFVVVLGLRAGRQLFATLLLLPFALVPLIAWHCESPWPLAPLTLSPKAFGTWLEFRGQTPGIELNRILLRTFRMGFAYCVLLALGIVFASRPSP